MNRDKCKDSDRPTGEVLNTKQSRLGAQLPVVIGTARGVHLPEAFFVFQNRVYYQAFAEHVSAVYIGMMYAIGRFQQGNLIDISSRCSVTNGSYYPRITPTYLSP